MMGFAGMSKLFFKLSKGVTALHTDAALQWLSQEPFGSVELGPNQSARVFDLFIQGYSLVCLALRERSHTFARSRL